MAEYNRPATGFRYKNGGMKTNAAPDAVGEGKYPVLVNVRSTTDDQLRTRPGQQQLFTTDGTPTTDLRAYVELETNSQSRFLARTSADKIYLDTGTQVGTLAGAGASPGATLLPFRPNESPDPYMYAANGSDYQKFSAPDAANAVVQKNVGIAEPQTPVDASVISLLQSFQGQPFGGAYTNAGTAGAVTIGNRINDSVVAVFPDPNGPGTGPPFTLQVSGGTGTLATAVYLYGPVLAYLYPANHAWNGGFGFFFPLAQGAAVAAAQGNSLRFNPVQFNGTLDPNVQPMEWANQDASGNPISYHPVPTASGQVGNENWDMVLLFQIYVPAAGNYTININHDDGMYFAIQGMKLISGPHNDGFNHVRTPIKGYTFTAGSSSVVAGTNQSGFWQETFVVNAPAAGVYSAEVAYAQWVNEQSLNIFYNGNPIVQAVGAQDYQREMAIVIAGNLAIVQDVFPALPPNLGISDIRYYDQVGLTGRCVVVPRALSPGPGTEGTSLYTQAVLGGLRRGSLVQIGSEVCYVLNTTIGPSGTICFETITTQTHTPADMLSGVPAIQTINIAFAGDAITSSDVEFACTVGIGTVTQTIAVSPFVNQFQSFQDEDYIHFSINVDNLANLNEAKLLFDVGDGSFTQDFYWYTVRPSDIAAGVQNTLSQLGVAQLVTQRAIIDEERAAESKNQGPTTSSAVTIPGSSQWSEILFPISALTRAGNQQTKTLQNVNSMQLLVNASGTVNIAWNSVTVTGGFAGDVGDVGSPYKYRVRPRDSRTGAKGNPSPEMRYGVNPRRELVRLFLPDPSYDPQIDTWDVYRYGGTITTERRIGSVMAVPGATFDDNYGDDAAAEGEALEYDNFQPWPSVDRPYRQMPGTQPDGTLVTTLVTGTELTVIHSSGTPITDTSLVGRYLPGNLIQIGGQQAYTLRTRPTQTVVTNPPGPFYVAWLFDLLENAGTSGVGPGEPTVTIYEPSLAQQMLPYMWGPDANGTVFAVGDSLRPGTCYFAKNYAPDSAPDSYNLEITAPSEPLLGGEIMDGVSYVASSRRWWRMYSQGTQFLDPQNRIQHYSILQQPLPRGLAAAFGHTNDGANLYWWAEDGIWSSNKGSLTDPDLYNLFPHDGSQGQQVTYNGVTVFPPDYSKSGSFRLIYSNGYLYAIYQDSTGTRRQLTLDIKRGAWCVDESAANRVTAAYSVEQPEGGAGIENPLLVFGTLNGTVAQQSDGVNDLAAPISGTVATVEWDAGDVRARHVWGDMYLDCIPASADLTVSGMARGAAITPGAVVPQSAARSTFVVSYGGGILASFTGLFTTWTDDYTLQTVPTTLYIWQPSYLNKPEAVVDRYTDWASMGDNSAARWVQGFLLHCDTFNQPKLLNVRDSDTLTTHTFTPAVQHAGESIKAYSFDVPFIAHQVRIEPIDQQEWRFFDVGWVTEPTPEVAETWQSQGTSFGMTGYMHVKQVSAAYAAAAAVTLTITSFDGQSPVPITLPATASAFEKITFQLTPNKGQLYFFKAASAAPFQMYLPDWEIMVGKWGRGDAYLRYQSLGGLKGDQAKI